MTSMLISNAHIITMDSQRSVAESMLVEDGRITAIGTDLEVARQASPATVTLDARGRTILPGFIDAHTHLELTTYSEFLWRNVKLFSVDETLATLREEIGRTPAGEWVVLQATFGQELPTLEQLDRVAPRHPVAIRWTMHKFQLNTPALTRCSLTTATSLPPGVRLGTADDGSLNGIVEEGWDLLDWEHPLAEDLEPKLRQLLHTYFLPHGVTTICEVTASSAGVKSFQRLARSGGIPRIGLAFAAAPGHQPMVDIDAFSRMGMATGFGSDRLWVQAIKIFLDGGRDGAFRKHLLDHHCASWGLLTRTPAQLAQELLAASSAGLQVWTHAIGDLAQEIALSAVEKVHEAHPELDHRLRIEHFFNESFGTDQLERLHAAGGIAVPNPGFVWVEPDDVERRLPAGADKYRLRTLKQITGLVPGNSDTAGAQPASCNPWFIIGCMTRQLNKNGVDVASGERLTVDQALEAFTRDAAYSIMKEDSLGSLEPGKLADFSIVDQDPYVVETSELSGIRTLQTYVHGQKVFERDE
jgi:predicted amidohydrolase YtcJ